MTRNPWGVPDSAISADLASLTRGLFPYPLRSIHLNLFMVGLGGFLEIMDKLSNAHVLASHE